MNTNNITITKSFCEKKDFYNSLSLFDSEETFKSKLKQCQSTDNKDRKVRFSKEQKETLKTVRELDQDHG